MTEAFAAMLRCGKLCFKTRPFFSQRNISIIRQGGLLRCVATFQRSDTCQSVWRVLYTINTLQQNLP